MNIIFLLANIIMSLIAFPMFMKMFDNNKITAANYKKEDIPICLGIVFIFIELITLSIHFLIFKESEVVLYLLGILSVGLIGLLDDLAGDIYVKGLKGHISSFFKGELTTGFLKAGIGFFTSMVLSIYLSNDPINVLINTLIISLSINSLNLFDLRPGRCLKVFMTGAIIFVLLAGFKDYFIILSMLVIALVYFPYDLKARAMMGDVGSNILGLSLGLYSTLTQSLAVRLTYLALLIFIHILAERVSISKIIEENKFLKFIDELGR